MSAPATPNHDLSLVNQDTDITMDNLSINEDPHMVEKDETSATNASSSAAEKGEQPTAYANSEHVPSSALSVGTDASKHADPCYLARKAYEKLKEEVAILESSYTAAINNGLAFSERIKKRKELEEAQCELEASRQAWRRQYPTRLEFYSKDEIDEAKRRNAALKEKSKKALVVPKALPALQLTGMPKWDDQRDTHTSAAAFLGAFEVELQTYGLNAEEEWERLLPRCLSYTQNLWLKEQKAKLKVPATWSAISDLILKKYDTQTQRIQAMLSVLNLRQQNRPLDLYCNEFQQRCVEAGMTETVPAGLLLVIIFLYSLSDRHNEKAITAIVNRFGAEMPTDLEAVCDLVKAMKLSDCGNKRTNNNEAHNDHKKQKANQDSSNQAPKKQKTCKWCGRKWKHGHKCDEYYEKNGLPNPKHAKLNRSAHVDTNDDPMDTLPCKSSKKQSKSLMNNDEVLTPITIENHQIMALVDGGATFSSIDIDFAKKSSFRINKVKGHISLGSNGIRVPRLGMTDPLTIIYNGKTHTCKFEVMNLARKHPMSIGWDLMPQLGIGYVGLATSWSTPKQSKEEEVNDEPFQPKDAPAGTPEEMQSFMESIQPLLKENTNIPPGSFCTIPESIIELNTPKDAKCYRRQYEFPIKRQQLVEDTIAQWLKEGIITKVPANIDNGWNSPLTFAPKKDAQGNKVGVRLCLDPRHINKYLPDDRHPLPLIRSVFDKLAGSSVFSTLDLKSAFHRFKIHEKDQHKTTFTSASGNQYMFVGCPFGLKPISAKFQRVMQILFEGLPFVTTFVDDIVVYSKNMEEHYAHIRIVLQKLTDAKLVLNPDKCHFAQKAVYLLGFRVSADGRALDSRKVTNVLTWPSPSTGKDIQRFLGVVNYFRDHIPNVSRLTARMDALRNAGDLKKLWTKYHEDDFQKLKYVISHAPMLRHVNLALPFHLATDASNDGIGAVLYQKEGGRNNIVGFMARALTKSEKNYSVTKRELLAVVFAFKKFHKFLWGQPFTLYTDHKALVYIHTQKDANPMMIKWLDTLLDYTFNVVYLPGIHNILPDHLSRLFSKPAQSLEGDKIYHAKSIKSQEEEDNSGMTMRAAQLEDTMEPPTESEKKEILQNAHLFGHFGADAIVKAVHSNGLHWPNIKEQAVELVKSCKECQKYNIAQKGYNPLRPIRSYIPGDHWAIDLAGPLTTSTRGNNYLLVMVDLCTRFCILRPIQDKQSQTIVSNLIQVFCDFGLPRILQSDNGTEFVNDLMKRFKRAAGFDHRLVSPYHPRANGVAERWVQTAMLAIKKRVQGVHKDWDLYVPAVQLAMNAKASTRLNTPPFSLMFARRLNDFKDYRKEEQLTPMSRKELLKRIEHMSEIVFPAIEAKTEAVVKSQKEHFDTHHRLVDFPTNSHVMKRVLHKKGKLHPEYEGPFTVVRKTKGGSYVLKDESGDLLPIDVPPSQLKLISQDDIVPADELYEVEKIIAHQVNSDGKMTYKVRWKGYGPDDDTWEPYEHFTSTEPITEYWERRNEPSPHNSGFQNRKRRQSSSAPSTKSHKRLKQ